MLYVLDASGFLFRAYYSLPSIMDKNWNDASAIFGFFRMVLKLLQEKPSNFVLAFDPWKKTKRMEEFSEYKANRPKIEDKFKNQIPVIIDICKQVWFNVEIIPWYEADDIICSIVKNCNKESFIISSDKDLKQLISDNVKFLEPRDMKITDKNLFFDEHWFAPSSMLLYLALLWDSSDNIPWVPWIWEKTASKIVSEFPDIDSLFENIHKLAPKLSEKIIQNKDLLEKNIKLIWLYEPWNYDSHGILSRSWFDNINFDKLKNILINEYGFKSFNKIIDKLLLDINKPSQMTLF